MKRTWNYRTLHHRAPRLQTGTGVSFNLKSYSEWYAMHEVHYEDGVPTMFTVDAVTFVWDVDDGPDDVVGALRRAAESCGEQEPLLIQDGEIVSAFTGEYEH